MNLRMHTINRMLNPYVLRSRTGPLLISRPFKLEALESISSAHNVTLLNQIENFRPFKELKRLRYLVMAERTYYTLRGKDKMRGGTLNISCSGLYFFSA